MTKQEALRFISQGVTDYLYKLKHDPMYKSIDIPDYSEVMAALRSNEIEWISVDKELPKKDGEYLLYGKYCDEDEEGYAFVGNYDSDLEKFGFFRDYYDENSLAFKDSEFVAYKVTAWTPLPELPKDSFEIGDEIVYGLDDPRKPMIVTHIDYENGYLECINAEGCVLSHYFPKLKKTGKHYPQVKEILNELKED